MVSKSFWDRVLFARFRWGTIAAVLIASAFSASAQLTLTGTAAGNDPGETNSAMVTFALAQSGTVTNLVITLVNTATYKPNDPVDILTGVFFSVAGDPNLIPISGLLSSGSEVLYNGSLVPVSGGVIGGSWAYANELSGAPAGADEGISATGLGLFGGGHLFPGAKIPGDKNPPGGLPGGLTTLVDDGSNYNGGLKGRPLISDGAVFTLGNVPASFTLADIANVSFQYGTSLSEPNIQVVPEPSTIALVLSGCLLLALIRRR